MDLQGLIGEFCVVLNDEIIEAKSGKGQKFRVHDGDLLAEHASGRLSL